ncbi:MAG: hypothetical protein PHI86_06700 [Candidatus Omnitrophica bacterium]|nr:hypothetical protein [Candidatus Omnitrophota bacterium]HOX55158.1 hypothetical protein [Candidatus Omnitrophota bacterium]
MMDKQQKQLIITAGLVLVLLIVWINALIVIKKRASKKRVLPKTVVAEAQKESPKPAQIIKQPEYPKETNLEWLRCPFSGKFYTGHKGDAADLKLAGILWDKEKPQAIINNEVVGAGNSIGSYTVVEIRQYSVVLTDGSNVFELKLESLIK